MTEQELQDADRLTRRLTRYRTFLDLMDAIRGGRIPLIECNASGLELAKHVKRCGGNVVYTVEMVGRHA